MRFGPRSLAGRLVGLVAMLLAIGPAVVVSAPAAQAYAPSTATVAAYQNRVIYWMNVVRASYHRGHLYPGWCPGVYAARWSPYLASTGLFYHQDMYTILGGCKARVAAENLARGNIGADRVVLAWMASPGHRKNILDGRLNRVGVAAYYSRGQWTVTADFTQV